MLLVVTTPSEGISAKHRRMVEACVHRIPEGITNRPRMVLRPRVYGWSKRERSMDEPEMIAGKGECPILGLASFCKIAFAGRRRAGPVVFGAALTVSRIGHARRKGGDRRV